MAVTASQVQRIIEYDTTLIPDLTDFIADAVLFATAVIGAGTLSTDMFDLVCRYLAAHFVAITDPRYQSEQVKSIQASYQYKLDLGLAVTHWGQMAMSLDTSGKLAARNRQAVDGIASFSLVWGGTDVPD